MTVYGSKFMFRATRNPVERIPAVCMKEKSKGGRPPKSASEKLKERLTVKMAAADYYALRGKARAAGLTWAEYARTALSRSVVRQRLTAEQMTLLRQLAGMANNLNQLARKANSAGYVQAAAECTALIEKIDTLIDQINE